MLAVAEAARNVACAGARPLGATNCLNFGNPERPAIMWQFAQGGRRDRRGLPRARRADHRRQRQPLQRDRRQGDLSDADHRRRRAARARRSRRRRATVPASPGDAIILLGDGPRRARRQRVFEGGLRSCAACRRQLDLECRAARCRTLIAALAGRSARASRRTTVRTAALAVTLAECCFDTGGIGADVAIDAAIGRRERRRREPRSGVVRRVGVTRRRLGRADRASDGAEHARRDGVPAKVHRADRRTPAARIGWRASSRSTLRWASASGSGHPRSNGISCRTGGMMFDKFKRRVRRLRHLRTSRSGQHDLPRALRAAAPRAGERRHRRVRSTSKIRVSRAMGYVADTFDSDNAVAAARADRDRPRPLLDRRRKPAARTRSRS